MLGGLPVTVSVESKVVKIEDDLDAVGGDFVGSFQTVETSEDILNDILYDPE